MKILGILALLLSGIGIAGLLVKEEERVLLRVRGWLELFLIVRRSVDSYSMSVPQILRGCGDRLLADVGYPTDLPAPGNFAELMAYGDIPDKESREAIEALLKDFGKSYRAQQVLRCDDCIERLREREAYIAQRLPIKKKIILSVSLCASVAVLILLL